MKKLSLQSIDDAFASDLIMSVRFPTGKPSCPKCGCEKSYWIETRSRHKCAKCYTKYTVYSSTHLSSQKMTNRTLVMALYLFCSAKKGISSLQLARDVGLNERAAYLLGMKFREAVFRLYEGVTLCGTVEIDGAFFGGHVRHMNQVVGGRSKRLGKWHYGNRKVVVVARQRMGKTLTFVGAKEADAKDFITSRVEDGSVVVVDQAHAWDSLLELYDGLRINHRWSFASNQTHTNNAESFFAALRRVQQGTHHHISGRNLNLYAQEAAWRLDNKRTPTLDMVRELAGALLAPRPYKNA